MSPKVLQSAALYAGAWGDEPIRGVRRLALERRIATSRPSPPDEVGEEEPARFVAAPDVWEWTRGTFIDPTGPLANEEHQHLIDAKIGVLWTNTVNVRQQRHILATAEIPQTMGGAWKRGRADQQLRDWFGYEPDFLLTFYAPECVALDDRAFCALVEHELLHCAQALDHYGSPRFDRFGAPVFALRGHDSEEFVSIMQRYGMGAVSDGTRRLVEASKHAPLIIGVSIGAACGTCERFGRAA